jgi:hypothetical protein
MAITNVYIDGFNLYYGALRKTPYMWLDLGSMCAKLLPNDQIKRIRYFTARIKAQPDDPLGPARQDAYLAALGSVPEVSIHYGHFLASKKWMRLVDPPPAPELPTVKVRKMEEKGSDVNLASWLLTDAFAGDCEHSVVVSNDSDLAYPISYVSQQLHIPVGIINPHPGNGSRKLLEQHPAFVKSIRAGVLRSSQLPDTVVVGNRTLYRPDTW